MEIPILVRVKLSHNDRVKKFFDYIRLFRWIYLKTKTCILRCVIVVNLLEKYKIQ